MKNKLRSLFEDLSVFGGIGLLTYGSWLIYRPAGFLVAGAALTALGIAASIRS